VTEPVRRGRDDVALPDDAHDLESRQASEAGRLDRGGGVRREPDRLRVLATDGHVPSDRSAPPAAPDDTSAQAGFSRTEPVGAWLAGP
jgi:hypothetical protein